MPNIDLTTLTGWESLSDGEHTVQIVAKGTGYRDSAKSTSVTVTKGGSTGETWVLNDDITQKLTKQVINFASDGRDFDSIECESYREDMTPVPYYRIFYGTTAVYYHAVGGWETPAYKTITFETAPTGDLLTWLQSNGAKQ